MKRENMYYDVTPRVVLEKSTAEVRITPLYGHAAFDAASRYEAVHRPLEDFGSFSTFSETRRLPCLLEEGTLVIKVTFEGEQEHSLVVERVLEEERALIGDFRFYSVARDLYDRRPYKGDLHLHSNRSDGREEPGYVAASCRKIGMDFMAITDHRMYEPSIEAQEAFADVCIDLRIFPGEEVHPPENPIHIINFGGAKSVNRMFDEPDYASGVESIRKRLGGLPPDLDGYFYASSLWCFERIRETGGLGIFCHPYWVSQNRYHIPGALTTKIFEEQPYDAYELIGGYHLHEAESNMLQVLRYQHEVALGRSVPVVGVSDAHGCDRASLFGWYYTVVFAGSLELNDLIDSIKELYSVAVEQLPGCPIHAYGQFRMAKYALFLLREVLPRHDELCRYEGELMLRHLAADRTAAGELERLSGRTAAYLGRCFGAK